MARPIEPTPILTGREAAAFINRVCEVKKGSVSVVPTPKLRQAQELIKKSGSDGQKRV